MLVPADDLTDPAPVIIFGHLDAITVLSRGLASKGIYPAVDPFYSTSKMNQANALTRQENNEIEDFVINQENSLDFNKKETKSLILVSYFDKFSEFRSKLIKRDTFSKKSIEKERIIGQNGLILDKMKRN